MQNISSIHKFILILQISGFCELKGHAHFWPQPPKNHWSNFYISWICTSMQKINLFHLFILETVNFKPQNQNGHTHFLNLYQPAKNHPTSSIFSVDSVNDTFWPISLKHNFSQIWDLCRNTSNNIKFHYRTNLVKINNQILQEFHETVFSQFFQFCHAQIDLSF